MKTIFRFFDIRKLNYLAISFLMIFLIACNGDQNQAENEEEEMQQESPEMMQEETEPMEEMEMEEETAEETDTEEQTEQQATQRVTYRQPRTAVQEPNKFVLDASSAAFKNLDTNNDKIIRKDEFYEGLFNLADEDGNSTISEDEFNSLKNEFMGESAEFASFSDWDENGDGITKEEMEDMLSTILDVGDEETLTENLYIIWDTDNDERIEKLELDNVTVRFDQDQN